MQTTSGVQVKNWEGSITSYPQIVVYPRTVDDLIAIMTDKEKYPSPVRAVGSNHSTTHCGVANGGTVVNMRHMNRIVEIDPDSVTAEGGALYIDVAKELERHGLQFYVNVELGNLSIGSASCGGTKDASMPGEYGQVCSYATGIKMVSPSGELLEFNEDNPELLQIARSSYGLMGIVYEVSFRVKPLQPLIVHHETYSLQQFVNQLPSLTQRGESMMFYLYPFLDAVTVEYRKYGNDYGTPNRFGWKIRNDSWSKWVPTAGYLLGKYAPSNAIRFHGVNSINRITQYALKLIVKGSNTIAGDQIIRYPETSGISKYTFSIWAFNEANYGQYLTEYFAFCQNYYRDFGFRCDMLNVGYRIAKDVSSLFSYSFNSNVMTLDPVSTGGPGWDDFLRAYNEFCSQRGGTPLFNQTKWITPEQARRAFGERLASFDNHRKQHDPENRLLNEYFGDILA